MEINIEKMAQVVADRAIQELRDNGIFVSIWTPVSEGLPKENGRYLVTRGLNACGDMWNRTYIINYSDLMGLKSERIWWDGNVGKSDFKQINDVIAWMPSPEPYKAESEVRADADSD